MRYSLSYFTFVGIMSVGASLGCSDAEPNPGMHEFVVRVANQTPSQSVYAVGGFDTPETQLAQGPIVPGESYRFDVVVHPGAQLQVVTMFVESNDAFLAFAPGGIALWTLDGEPIEGERTSELFLYDAGTERNEALGQGDSQPLRQAEPGAGVAEDGYVTVISDGNDGAADGPDGVAFPAISDFIALHVVHLDGPHFRVAISNVSSKNLLGNGGKQDDQPALLSPGAYSVHAAGVEWFEIGEALAPQLEGLVEDADPEQFVTLLEYMQGVSSDLTGVVWAIHEGDASLCQVGSAASEGLEDLVENASPDVLLDELSRNPAILDYGYVDRQNGSPVLEPGEAVELRVSARPGARLELMTGYLATNDKFIGACEAGILLFEADGTPRSGDLGWAADLYDAGTELDEPPGLGANQFERQQRSGSGPDEGGIVREVRDAELGWDYPLAERIVKIDLAADLDAESSAPIEPGDGDP